ncbi:uncharacterized protein LOC134802414 [Cydia splendana]|uniref:uncharacterized protein LOC134802414 n=1 Tax=Cydia splendana TaxID=1100963 RepID=UPI00300D9C62
MNTQKNHRKIQLHKDRGDTMRRNKRELHSTGPRDRGDVKKCPKKVSKRELFKTTKAESMQTDFVSRSTNTLAESLPLSTEKRTISEDVSVEETLNFRKRVKDRYTFKRHQVLKNEDTSQSNCAMQRDDKYDPSKHHFQYVEKQKSKDSRDAKKLDRTSVHRAVSAIKLKRSSKLDDLSERKKSHTETEKNNNRKSKPAIKTLTSKMDARVHKAVTFVELNARKPQVKIPNYPKPNSKIPVIVVKNSKTPQSTKRFRKTVRQASPTFKSAESMPTEIAKWVPESVDAHTRPYYDAWVSKTATASTKLLKEANVDRAKLLRRLELEIRRSPELLYRKFAEEEYAGRIRVKRRGEK